MVLAATMISFSWTHPPVSPYEKEKDPIKLDAFKVLENKCNACHHVQKPFYVFTWDNMDKFAKDIHSQVFVKKKMPKGDAFNLTSEETESLKKWLELYLQKKK